MDKCLIEKSGLSDNIINNLETIPVKIGVKYNSIDTMQASE